MSHAEELKDFIKLQINQPLEMKSESKPLEEFWYTALDMFLRFGGKAFKVLIPFATYVNLNSVLFCQSRQHLDIT